MMHKSIPALIVAILLGVVLGGCLRDQPNRPVSSNFDRPTTCWPHDCRDLFPIR
jgi:hypothetical protein